MVTSFESEVRVILSPPTRDLNCRSAPTLVEYMPSPAPRLEAVFV
jgi:hypothetical protein